MKRISQLMVVIAVLLLLTGVASALTCTQYCYSVTCTNLENGMVIADHPVAMCFDFENQAGPFDGFCDTSGGFKLFFDTRKRALAYDTLGNDIGLLEFHGGLDGVTGIGICAGDRWEFRGHRVDWEHCNELM